MAKSQLCILLGIGLLAAGRAPDVTRPEDMPLSPRPAAADTSRTTALGVPRRGDLPWNRFDARFRARGDSLVAQQWLMNRSAVPPHEACAPSHSEPVVDPKLWGANGNVLGIARSGNTLYIAGSFRSMGENSGGCVPFDARTGEALRPFPKVAGFVHTIVPDGAGGWYLGGEFSGVGGKPRSCLAHVLSDGSVSDWNPSVTGSPGYIDPPGVNAIAVNGNRVFVGGGFREIGGLPRGNLGCVDATTGAVLDWTADTPVEARVYAMAVHDTTLFVGGSFTDIGGQPRASLAAFNAAPGALAAWQADVYGGVNALLVRDDTLYVGGNFLGVAGVERHMLVAIDIGTAGLLPFDAQASGVHMAYLPDPEVRALALAGDTLYVAGDFTQIGGQARPSLAALNATTGDALAWTPDSVGPQYEGFPPRLCTALAARESTVYVGGFFETLDGVSHPFTAALSRATGKASDWNPKLNDAASALAVAGDTVWVGGYFVSVGEWRHRAGLAAIDLTTGTLKPWNPNPDGSIVTAVVVSGNRVFVSGDFTKIGGEPMPRSYFAALDTLNGEALAWNPGANSAASVLLLAGDTLYAGGYFTRVGGQARNYLTAIDATTGEVTGWNPNASWPVRALVRSGSIIFVGGQFGLISNMGRRGIAAVDATTGDLLPWRSDTDDGVVEAIAIKGNTMYVGGKFGEIGGQPRRSLAALDVTTGEATSWYPQPTAWGSPTEIKALALADSTLYIGGVFGTMGGQPRICLASVDTSSSFATDWDPGADGYVWSLLADGSTLYVGGGFTRVGGLPSSGLAAFSLPQPPPPPPRPTRLAIGVIRPNPVHSVATLPFTLPSAGKVTLEVFDVRGRRVETILGGQARPAGFQEVPLHTEGWPLGLYVCRLEVGGVVATRKMLVVR